MSNGLRWGPPSGVITFLFTDIEGSTRRWESDAHEMRSALARHDEALCEAVEGHGGWLFKHTGDGICAAFASPSGAVEAAIAAQRALELPVRMGIATGEAELRGDDYFGSVLNRVARLMSTGHGGQILIDGTTADMVSGVDLVAFGPKRLRDIAKPVEVSQVAASGLRVEFPPLKTDDSAPGNLRLPTTSLVGREADLAELESALKAHRLVTLTGVGGVGKTRLALEVAARVSHSFSDGVWVVELAAVGDPAAVPDAVAAVLGVIPQANSSLAESIALTLEGRSRLLVLDNCEHVLDATADLVEAVLARSDSVRIIATSREGLRLADEQLWPVPSLDVRAGTDSPAVTLFIDRAQAVSPELSLVAEDEASAVAEICRRLDGIPLAIELAASRSLSMTATELRDRLDDRFRLLVGSRRGLERHQTLRHAVQWSYDLLDDAEKSLLLACAVFAGGFDLNGACAVAGATDELATLDLLDSLVRKSLLVTTKSAARTRFSMLETIRQFTEEQLVQCGGAGRVRGAHARYFAGKEAEVLAIWDGPRQREAYEWFGVEAANLRSAFRWAADNDDIDTAATIAFYGAFLGSCLGQLEGVAWAEELIEPAKASRHPRLVQLYGVAIQCYQFGRVDDSIRYAEEAEAAIASGEFAGVPTRTEATLGIGYITAGKPERLAELSRRTIAREPKTNPFSLACLVNALTIAGDFEQAKAKSEEMLIAANDEANPARIVHALLAYGFANTNSNPEKAYEVLRRALVLSRSSGNRDSETHLATLLSRLAPRYGTFTDALEYFTIAMRGFYDAGSFSLMPSPIAILAAFLDQLGQHESAATLCGCAMNLLTPKAFPEFNTATEHLRSVLGDDRYEALAREGAAMTNTEMANYAFEQIDIARAQLSQTAGS